MVRNRDPTIKKKKIKEWRKSMKKFIVTILTICTLATTAFASTLPNSIREYKENNDTYIVKTYEVVEGTEEEHLFLLMRFFNTNIQRIFCYK